MNFENQIEEILSQFCNTNVVDDEVMSFKINYLQQARISYIKNLSTIANYLKRNAEEILKFIKPQGLKVYTLEYKNEVLYGFIMTLQIKNRIQQSLEKYIYNIKCKKCNSRFTELNFQNPNVPYTYCKSCGNKSE